MSLRGAIILGRIGKAAIKRGKKRRAKKRRVRVVRRKRR